VALSLAGQGYALTVTARRAEALERTAAELRAAGSPRVEALAADMADHEALPGLVELHERTFGSMSALVLNAGVGTAGDLATFPMYRMRKTVDVNLVAPVILIQAALPLLRRWAETEPVAGAKVVAMSSITGVYAERELAIYGATKAGLLSLVDTLNREEARHGITASAVAPGYVATDMSAWTTDTIPVDEMIPVGDVVTIVEALMRLSRATSIARVVMSRSGSNGYQA
jgi:short-subunit dehydrogenase